MKSLLKKTGRFGAHLAAPFLYAKYFHNTKSPLDFGRVCLTFDLDLPEDYDRTPVLLDTLSSFGISGGFGIIGKWVEKLPAIHRRMLDEGHEIMNHTYSHPNNEVFNPDKYFNKISVEEQETEVIGFEKTAAKILGYKPVGFRTPHFGDLNTESIYGILEKRGYKYSTSGMMTRTKNGGLPFFPKRGDHSRPGMGEQAYPVLEMPVACCPVHYFPTMDSVHCVRQATPAHPGGEFFDIFCQSVRQCMDKKLIAIYDFGPQDVGGLKEFERMLEWMQENKIRVENPGKAADAYLAAIRKK